MAKKKAPKKKVRLEEVAKPKLNPGGTTKPYEKPGNAKLRKAKAKAASKGK